ncbi:MAG: hypothetical protein HYV29_09575 [Ignavibacteriales bacterium]|nr:hypothetical protein [Ignavibacteriales bacterium]
MNLEAEILKEHSKRQAIKISRWIGGDEVRFAGLMTLFLTGEHHVAQRASWIVSHCADRHPHLIGPWIAKMIKRASEKNVHDAVKRNVVRVLQFVAIPKKFQGIAADLCFGFLQSVESPIAVKAFSMTVLANIADDEPDLKRELSLVLKEMLPFGSSGIRARAKKILHKIEPQTLPVE